MKALPPYERKGKRISREKPLHPIDSYSTRYGNSTNVFCPRCETRPVYLRNINGWLTPADCCISCRRAEQALADYWRLPDVNMPLAQYNDNMRVRLTPIRRNPIGKPA